MKRTFGLAALVGVVICIALLAWWRMDLRWRPHTLDRDAERIAVTLDRAGWVSPGRSHAKVLWMISYRSCPDCIRFEKEMFPRLQGSGVDTRVIMAPRPRGTTSPERASIAAIWATRSWPLYEQWTSMPLAAWTAPGLPSADADPARAAELRRSQAFIAAMTPLLAENGVALHYPTLIWRDARGRLRGCACEKRETYGHVLSELGVERG